MRIFDLPAGTPFPISHVRLHQPELATCHQRGCLMTPINHFEVRSGRMCRQFTCNAPDGSSGVAWLPDVEFSLVE